MLAHPELRQATTAAAEEVLRIIYGDDLAGCQVSLDQIADAIGHALEEPVGTIEALAALHTKGFEAVELLATPPAEGSSMSAEDLRSLLGERLDSIREVATKILQTTKAAAVTDTRAKEIDDV